MGGLYWYIVDSDVCVVWLLFGCLGFDYGCGCLCLIVLLFYVCLPLVGILLA